MRAAADQQCGVNINVSESQMDIHAPKHPIHGWREFLKEVGIIVLGVLIALGAEQSVETIHWRHKVEEAEGSMRLELRDDDGPQAFTRAAMVQCFALQLDTLQGAIEGGRDRRAVIALAQAYTPPVHTWDSEAWKAALASDAASHTSADRMVTWSKPYRNIPVLQELNMLENGDLVELQPTRRAGGPLSTVESDRMLAAVERLRITNQQMAGRSSILLLGMAMNGVELRPAERTHIMQGLRALYGDCVREPTLKDVRPMDQLSGFRRAAASR